MKILKDITNIKESTSSKQIDIPATSIRSSIQITNPLIEMKPPSFNFPFPSSLSPIHNNNNQFSTTSQIFSPETKSSNFLNPNSFSGRFHPIPFNQIDNLYTPVILSPISNNYSINQTNEDKLSKTDEEYIKEREYPSMNNESESESENNESSESNSLEKDDSSRSEEEEGEEDPVLSNSSFARIMKETPDDYIDKTRYVYRIVRAKVRKSILVRPKRFGKTVYLDTIKCYFEGDKNLLVGPVWRSSSVN